MDTSKMLDHRFIQIIQSNQISSLSNFFCHISQVSTHSFPKKSPSSAHQSIIHTFFQFIFPHFLAASSLSFWFHQPPPTANVQALVRVDGPQLLPLDLHQQRVASGMPCIVRLGAPGRSRGGSGAVTLEKGESIGRFQHL